MTLREAINSRNMIMLQEELLAIKNPSFSLEIHKARYRKWFKRTGKTSLFKKEFRYIDHLSKVDPDKPIKFAHCFEDV